MGSATCTVLYVGHGAFNYIEVKDDDGNVEKRIIIDAGSTGDGLLGNEPQDRGIKKIANQRKAEMQEMIQQSGKNEVIVCLTHTDIDHCSFFIGLLKDKHAQTAIEAFYIGSASALTDLINRNTDKLYSEIYKAFIENGFTISFPSTGPDTLWKNDEFELCVLFNKLCSEVKEPNCNSANYLFGSKCGGNAMWFTGDSTGQTFRRLLSCDILCQTIKDKFQHYSQICITVPHHGSFPSFQADSFIFQVPREDGEGNEWNWAAWGELCDKLGLESYDMIASFGANDSHRHPSGFSMYVYAERVSDVPDVPGLFYQAFQSRLQEPIVVDEDCRLSFGSYIQSFPNKPGVVVTCTYEDGQYAPNNQSYEF